MNIDSQILEPILLKEGYVSEEEMKKAKEAISKSKDSLLDYFLNAKILNKELVGQALAESFNVSYVNVHSSPSTSEYVQKIPEEIAKKYHAVLFSEDKTQVSVATDDPKNPELIKELKKIFVGKKIVLAFSFFENISPSFAQYQKPLETRFSEIIAEKGHIAPEILEEIFNDAFVFHASDIHFEPQRKEVLVRFRVDGVLHEAGRIPKEFYENILNRLKVQSGMRIDEHLSAQDGSIRYEKKDVTVDLRASIVPTVEGEKVVLRVLAAYIQGFSLDDIGLTKGNQELLRQAADRPFGMILVVGPTGSGKTTTLYALLKLVNHPDVNITTIEDPVEYKVVGINQIQTNIQSNLTFAKGLRAIVRQDPDIILVGEIRDEETAEIAVNAALTGHLLYSTFHANDAATALPRLLDMGVEPFLLASTLNLVVAQRLVRKICHECRRSVKKTAKDFNTPQLQFILPYFGSASITLYEGKKCAACGHTGYKGRTAIYEFIQMTPQMQNLLLKSPSTQEIWQLARSEGAKTLFEDGIQKVQSGIISLEELLRVAEPPSVLISKKTSVRKK